MHDRQYFIPEEEGLDSQALSALQRRKLSAMFREVMAGNAFYRSKYAGLACDPERDPLDTLPFTTRAELEQDQIAHPLYGTNLTYPLDRYCRFNNTTGPSGQPPRWMARR